jgi:hypothetical protein
MCQFSDLSKSKPFKNVVDDVIVPFFAHVHMLDY